MRGIHDEPRCLVLEDQHEHSNSTRNSRSRLAKSNTIPNRETHCLPQSLSNCSNVTLTTDLQNVLSWCNSNNMSLNVTKT